MKPGIMTLDINELRQKAEAGVDENFKFRHFLKRHPSIASEAVDNLVFTIADRVWKKSDCAACANCCRELVPTLSHAEVEQLAGHLGISQSEFASKYLQPTEGTEDLPWAIRERPCPFLKDNRCSVYEYRPANCRDYPYLDKPNFTERALRMIDRISECPIVFEVWEELKKETGFRRQVPGWRQRPR